MFSFSFFVAFFLHLVTIIKCDVSDNSVPLKVKLFFIYVHMYFLLNNDDDYDYDNFAFVLYCTVM